MNHYFLMNGSYEFDNISVKNRFTVSFRLKSTKIFKIGLKVLGSNLKDKNSVNTQTSDVLSVVQAVYFRTVKHKYDYEKCFASSWYCYLDGRQKRAISSYPGRTKQFSFMCTCGSDQTLGSMLAKFCTQVPRQIISVQFADGLDCLNLFKIVVILKTYRTSCINFENLFQKQSEGYLYPNEMGFYLVLILRSRLYGFFIPSYVRNVRIISNVRAHKPRSYNYCFNLSNSDSI